MDALERFLELDERPLSLYLSPQGDRPLRQPALLREAIVVDHPRDACEPIEFNLRLSFLSIQQFGDRRDASSRC